MFLFIKLVQFKFLVSFLNLISIAKFQFIIFGNYVSNAFLKCSYINCTKTFRWRYNIIHVNGFGALVFSASANLLAIFPTAFIHAIYHNHKCVIIIALRKISLSITELGSRPDVSQNLTMSPLFTSNFFQIY